MGRRRGADGRHEFPLKHRGPRGRWTDEGPKLEPSGPIPTQSVVQAVSTARLPSAWPSYEPCGEKTFGMVVIARFPRLDPTATAACPVVSVVPMAVATTTALAPADVTAPRALRASPVSVVAAVPGRSRAPRARFPAVSTLVLAVVAGMFWAAVWREEQRRAAEDGNRDREAVAMEPDGEAGLIR